jgi:superfamily II DNA or RNA helicase
MLNICDQIAAGKPIRDIFCLVTPGGGKSALPIIAAKVLIDAGLADALCWVVPRNSLQSQAEGNFMDRAWRDALGHNNTIRASTNDENPCRSYQGFVTTYQALGMDRYRTAARDFERRRYIFFLDEFHHCEVNSEWHGAIQEFVDLAHFRILVTGTLERGNGKRIAWVPYRLSGSDGDTEEYSPDLKKDHPRRSVISYTRTDALAEKAILPIHFFFNDASVKFMTMAGGEMEYNSLQGVRRKDQTAALGTALATEYANELLDLAVGHWKKYLTVNASAKLLVVTSKLEHAERAVTFLKTNWKEYNIAIATSHNPENAERAIRNFKHGNIRILVTIAMAYEGLDVPEISHIACLTHIRSTPWIEQMLARAVRINRRPEAGSYEKQIAYVFAPKDDLFMGVVQKIEAEQAPVIKEQKVPSQLGLFDEDQSGPGEEGTEAMPAFIPLESRLTRSTAKYNGPSVNPVAIPETPSERECRIKGEIENHVRRFAIDNFYTPKKINAEIATRCGKKRGDMTIGELEQCLVMLHSDYPLNGLPAVTNSGSQPRAVKRRFPTEAQPWNFGA